MSRFASHSVRRAHGHSVVAALCGAAIFVLAQPRAARAEPHDPAAAETLFGEGRRLMKAHDYAAACPKLAESYRLDPAAGTLLNLADCEEQLGRTASAWEHYRAAADLLGNDDRRRPATLARATALERVLPHLTITLAAGAPVNAEVTRDGVSLGPASLSVPLPVDPGHHTILVEAFDHEPRQLEVTLRAAERRTVVVEPGRALPRPAGAQTAESAAGQSAVPAMKRPVALPGPADTLAGTGETAGTADHARTTTIVGFGLLGVGALALGAGVFFGLQARAARQDAGSACMEVAGGERCWVDARGAIERDTRDSLLADVGFGIGLLSAAVGSYLLLRSPHDEPAPKSVARLSLRAVGFAPRPGGGALAFSGRF